MIPRMLNEDQKAIRKKMDGDLIFTQHTKFLLFLVELTLETRNGVFYTTHNQREHRQHENSYYLPASRNSTKITLKQPFSNCGEHPTHRA
ncbi:hypothetical protein TNCV_3472031 [Trichonephila clavipes]|nr:hypothetical protein TNCV_3472031 [Trichonephila clavipes]